MVGPDDLNQLARARTASDGSTVAVGRIISHCDAPTVTLEDDEGGHATWRADLCELLTADAAIEYWRTRAERAERDVKALKLGGRS